jgi:hypothetical protein
MTKVGLIGGGEEKRYFVENLFCFFFICFLEVMFDNIVMLIGCFDNVWHGFCV